MLQDSKFPWHLRRAANNFPFSGEIFVQIRASEIRFESEIPVVFRNADLGKKIPGNAVDILSRIPTTLFSSEYQEWRQ